MRKPVSQSLMPYLVIWTLCAYEWSSSSRRTSRLTISQEIRKALLSCRDNQTQWQNKKSTAHSLPVYAKLKLDGSAMLREVYTWTIFFTFAVPDFQADRPSSCQISFKITLGMLETDSTENYPPPTAVTPLCIPPPPPGKLIILLPTPESVIPD